MIEVSVLRHSKTKGNLSGRYIGVTDEPLCHEGILLLEGKCVPAASRLYVSPLKRCVETGRILYPSLSPIPKEGLAECDFGEFENRNYLELNGNPAYQAWVDSGGTLPFPGGESMEAFALRCQNAFLEVIEDAFRSGDRQIAIIAHGGTIMAVLSRFAVPERSFYEWQVKNGEGYLLQVPDDFLRVQHLTVLRKL